MTIHLAPTVKSEPHVLLTHWMLLETASKTRHFVGYCSKTKTGRVSSAIRYFDPYRRRGVTESGRVYEFIGGAGINSAELTLAEILHARHGTSSQMVMAISNIVGSCISLMVNFSAAGALVAGVHRLTFATGDWFEAQGVTGFYPQVTVVCRVEDPSDHYHVPLLLSPYGYSTYRGS